MTSRVLLHSISSPHEANIQLKQLILSGRLHEARHMFDGMPQRDKITWTTLISGYVKSSNPKEALSLFTRLHSTSNLSLSADDSILSLTLKASSSSSVGRSIHAFALKSGALPSSIFVSTNLLNMYSHTTSTSSALQVFDEIPSHNAVSWTAAITALVHAGRYHDAIRWFVAMRQSGTQWDSHTLAIIFKACAEANLLLRGKEVHSHAINLGFAGDVFVANALSAMYSKCGDLPLSVLVFRNMCRPDVVAWTSLISTYVQMRREECAVHAFVRMQDHGVSPNEYTFSAAISATAGLADAVLGEQLHAQSLRRGFVGAMTVANSLVTLYSRTGRLDSACKMFREETRVRDIVSWSAIISAHAVEGYTEESFSIFSEMRRSGIRANEFPLSSLLSTCAYAAMLEAGRQVHALAVSVGLESEPMVVSALINMYSKCGSIVAADWIFNDTKPENVVSWTAMINGYAEHGRSEDAIDLFGRMVVAGLKPDRIAYMGVLTACSHSGMVDLGLEFFESMKREHGIEPQKEHYGCMVDLLGRAGRLREAEAMIEAMPWRADEVMWSAVLRACGLHGDAELGRKAAQRVLEFEPECAGAHVALSNIFMAKGRWREAAEMRWSMRRKGVRKEAGWSWIGDGEGGLSVFTSKDRSHSRDGDIYAMMQLVYLEARTEEHTVLAPAVPNS